jgi:hypothetical protein
MQVYFPWGFTLNWPLAELSVLVVICEGGNLSLSDYPLASSKPQVTGDVSPGPHLPEEKEPSHRGDIGWDRFLLRQFGPLLYSLLS